MSLVILCQLAKLAIFQNEITIPRNGTKNKIFIANKGGQKF